MMQLKEKLDLSFLKSKKQTMFKVVFSILGFALITAVAFLILWLCQFLNLLSALNHIPLSFMAVVFCIMFVLSLFTCTVGLSKTLYYAKDNQVLITYPVTSNTLYLSKMLVYYINEIKKTFTFIIPIFFAYGLLSSLPILYYIWMPLMLVIFASIPVLLGGILSIPTNYIMRFFKNYPIVKVILLCLLLGGVVVGVVAIINAIPDNINLIASWTTVSKAIREFLSWFTQYFYVFYAFIIFLCGKYENLTSTLFTEYSWIVLLIMIGVIAVLVSLNYLLSRPLYLKIASKQFEFNKDIVFKKKHNPKHKTFASACLYESRRCVRDTNILSSSIATLIVAPIAILLLNSIYSAINTRIMGDYFTICFNILIILLFVLSNNINISSIYSKDGEALYLNKTKPNKPYMILFPRLMFNGIISLIVLVATSSIFMAESSLKPFDSICIFFIMFGIVGSHMFWSAEIDFLNPRANIFKTEGMAGVNPNELKSTILAFAMAGIVFGFAIFLLFDSTPFVWLKLAIISSLFMAYRIYLFYYKSRVLFKER